MISPKRLLLPSLAALLVALAPQARAADLPRVIRLAFPGVGTGNRPVSGGTALSTVHLQGLLEEEFKKDGVKIEWYHFRQAGPAVNEAFANGLIDFAYEGDLAMIIGKAGGLRTRVLLGTGQGSPAAVAVPADSPIKSIADLKGKRVVISKGTALQLAADRILAKFGLSEKDLRVVNIVGPGATDVLATKDVDAVFYTGSALYSLRDRGVARIIYEAPDPDTLILGGFLGLEDFIQKYPAVTQRIVTTVVKAAQYNSNEANRDQIFKLWGQDGTGYGYYKERYIDRTTGRPVPLAIRATPLLDEYWLVKIHEGVTDSLKYRLIRKEVDVRAWIEPRFLDAALKELKLEKFWTPYLPSGKPVS